MNRVKDTERILGGVALKPIVELAGFRIQEYLADGRLGEGDYFRGHQHFGMSGGEWLQRLAQRRVTFPILVVSGSFSVDGWETYAKQCAGPDLNVSFLTKPYTMDLFQLAVRKCLGPGGYFRRGG